LSDILNTAIYIVWTNDDYLTRQNNTWTWTGDE